MQQLGPFCLERKEKSGSGGWGEQLIAESEVCRCPHTYLINIWSVLHLKEGVRFILLETKTWNQRVQTGWKHVSTQIQRKACLYNEPLETAEALRALGGRRAGCRGNVRWGRAVRAGRRRGGAWSREDARQRLQLRPAPLGARGGGWEVRGGRVGEDRVRDLALRLDPRLQAGGRAHDARDRREPPAPPSGANPPLRPGGASRSRPTVGRASPAPGSPPIL